MTIQVLPHEADIDFVSLLKDGSTHYVSIAMPGLTIASHAMEFGAGIDTRHRNDLMMKVNHAGETGTLYPRTNITLLPSPTASYGGVDRNVYHDGDYPEEDVIAHILDAFRANAEYVKSPRMYFDFRNLSVSEQRYVACLRMALERIPSESRPSEVITFQPGPRP